MRRILIVEDEKLIRQGIRIMIERSLVPFSEILEAKNGEVALEILKSVQIDLVISDIRMPKMNGIELVGHIKDLPYRPEVVVVSGYDDFNYAIELLKLGVRDYILKPIERKVLSNILHEVEEDFIKNQKRNRLEKKMGYEQLKYFLLKEDVNDDDISNMENFFESHFINKSYYLIITSVEEVKKIANDQVLILNDIDENIVIICTKEVLNDLIKQNLKGQSIGISQLHEGFSEIRLAYSEALIARKEAFIQNSDFIHYHDSEIDYEEIADEFSERFIQMFGTGEIDRCVSSFTDLYSKAKKSIISADVFLDTNSSVLDLLFDRYKKMIDFNIEDFIELKNPLKFNYVNEYFLKFVKWLEDMQIVINQEFSNYKTKEKINEAIIYINDNYANDLNMAVVSNFISMNYSLFSLNFKEFTGMNFVNYLKNIRIEKAKELLAGNDGKIHEISQSVGYSNEKHFMKVFKSVTGVSPSEYRKNMRISKK